ncbi:MAG: hypothetical protein HYS27_19715 [Deltaproteobacteria bacterium]|nr:hypothetical protein [Deltaproteobacteria bacterium]
MASLRAVYDDGKRHSDGKVVGLWSSGLVVETEVVLPIGSPVALVVLSGGFDGERLGAQVAGVEKGRLLLDLLGLDTARWSLLQALIDGKPRADALPVGPLSSSPPANAPAFIVSGGEDELGDPTDAVPLAPAPRRAPAPVAVPHSEFQLPTPLGGARATSRPPTNPVDEDSSSAFELQLMDLGRAKAALEEENQKLRADLQRVTALKSALEDELKEALERLDAIERSLKR